MQRSIVLDGRCKGYRFTASNPPMVQQKRMSARANRAGKRFGRLLVVEDLGPSEKGFRWWGCRCDCGEQVAVRSRELDRGHTQSCGCLKIEASSRAGGRNKLPRGEASLNELMASYMKSAKTRGYLWSLTKDQFRNLVTGECVYCGVKLDRERKPNAGVNGGFRYTGIDRVDNQEGYSEGNVVPCCWDCNRAKGSLSMCEFKNWIARLIEHSTKQNRRFMRSA